MFPERTGIKHIISCRSVQCGTDSFSLVSHICRVPGPRPADPRQVRFPFVPPLVHIVGCHFWESINPGLFRQINVGERKSGSGEGIVHVVLDAVIR